MHQKCYYCRNLVDINHIQSDEIRYSCSKCGHVRLWSHVAEEISDNFNNTERDIISIVNRNEWENSGRKHFIKPRELTELKSLVKQYRPLDPLEKMDVALRNLDKASRYPGEGISVQSHEDFPYYHCFHSDELNSILKLLFKSGFIDARDPANPQSTLNITPQGYQKLRDLKLPNLDSRQCFVAMWFSDETNPIYEKAIKPAIEYKEEGATEPRFKAIKIDNVEHINDINDEIIAQIRRSRFMVCDLTGYRGGVYFEAGFAYGLGLQVIFTCRKDWCDQDDLFYENEIMKELEDSNGRKIRVQKEGIHFDLAHRNRIMWEEDKLADFRQDLENRIKSVIV